MSKLIGISFIVLATLACTWMYQHPEETKQGWSKFTRSVESGAKAAHKEYKGPDDTQTQKQLPHKK